MKKLHKFVAFFNLFALPPKRLRWFALAGTIAVVVVILISFAHFRTYYLSTGFLTEGKSYMQEGEMQKAIDSFQKVIDLNPRYVEAYVFLSKVYIQEGKVCLAVDELLRATEVFPNNPPLLEELRQAYQKELHQSSAVLKVGVRSELNPLSTVRAIEPLLNHLSKNMTRRIELVIIPGSISVNGWLREGKIDMAILGPQELMKVESQGSAFPLLLVASNAQSVQRSVIVASSQANVSDIKDLKGKSFAFASRESLTGYTLARMVLSERGIVPEKDFTQVFFMSSQEEVFSNLAEGKVDAGALAEHVFEYLSSTSPLSESVQVIARSAEVPANVMVVSENMSPQLIAEVKNLLLSYSKLTKTEGMFQEYAGLSIKEENSPEGKVYTVIFTEF